GTTLDPWPLGLLLYSRVNVARRQHVIRRAEAEIVDVIADVGPPVRHARRDDDDVAGLDDALHDIGSDDHAAARWSVELGRHLRIRRRLAAVDDAPARDEGAAAGDDQVALGL